MEVCRSQEGIEEPLPELRSIVLKTRIGRRSSIFLNFVSKDLLIKIWEEERNGGWDYFSGRNGRRTIKSGAYSENMILKFIAIKVRIFDLHKVPQESESHARPLQDAFVKLLSTSNTTVHLSRSLLVSMFLSIS